MRLIRPARSLWPPYCAAEYMLTPVDGRLHDAGDLVRVCILDNHPSGAHEDENGFQWPFSEWHD
jgi:hypothetical protein